MTNSPSISLGNNSEIPNHNSYWTQGYGLSSSVEDSSLFNFFVLFLRKKTKICHFLKFALLTIYVEGYQRNIKRLWHLRKDLSRENIPLLLEDELTEKSKFKNFWKYKINIFFSMEWVGLGENLGKWFSRRG